MMGSSPRPFAPVAESPGLRAAGEKAVIAGLDARMFEQPLCRLVGNSNAVRLDVKAAAGNGVARVGERQSGARPAQTIEGPV